MRKDYFYISDKDPETKEISALKVTGYSEGDIGVHKTKDYWTATHIPTGLRLTSYENLGKHKTRQQALKEANKVLENPVCEKSIEKHKETEAYEAFRQSRYNQTVSTLHCKEISKILEGR